MIKDYRTRAINGRSWIIAAPKKLPKIGVFCCIIVNSKKLKKFSKMHQWSGSEDFYLFLVLDYSESLKTKLEVVVSYSWVLGPLGAGWAIAHPAFQVFFLSWPKKSCYARSIEGVAHPVFESFLRLLIQERNHSTVYFLANVLWNMCNEAAFWLIKCESCGNRFVSIQSMIHHVSSKHEGKKPYKC